MEAKIIKRSVAPNRFVIYENDAGCSFLFRVDKINDGISVEELDGYLQIESESGFTDKIALSKSIGETEVYFTCTTSLSLTGQAGLISAQISFENAQKTIVYNTEIFYIDVKETIDGLESYQNIVPSVIESLQTEMRQKVDVCEELKNQTLAVKQEIEEIKAEVDEKHQDISQSAVLSVNGKTGNAILSAQDVGAISSSVKSLPNPEILNINGVGYDGSQAVTIDIGNQLTEVVEQNARVFLQNEKTYFVEQPTKIYINKNNLGKTAPERAVMYLNFKKDTEFSVSAYDFIFSGDGTSGGDFMREEGFYRLEFLCAPYLEKVRVFCKKFDTSREGYADMGSFPLTVKGKEGGTYYYGVSGNLNVNLPFDADFFDYSITYEDSIEGVGEKQSSGTYAGKCCLRVLSETANLFPLVDKTVKMSGVTTTFEKATNLMTINGTVTSQQSTTVFLKEKIFAGRKYGLKVFFKGGTCKSTCTKPLFHIGIRDFLSCNMEIAVYADGRYENVGTSGAFAVPEDNIADFYFRFTEDAIGTEFIDCKFGLFLGIEGYMDEFVEHECVEALTYINKPLLSYNGKSDEVDMINNRIIRRVGVHEINYIDELQSAEAPYENNLKFMGKLGGGLIAEDKEIDVSGNRPVYVIGLKDELHKDAIVVNPDYVIFKQGYFPTYTEIQDYYLPYVIVYAYKTEKYEKFMYKNFIKFFDGVTHVSVCSNIKPSTSFLKTIVK